MLYDKGSVLNGPEQLMVWLDRENYVLYNKRTDKVEHRKIEKREIPKEPKKRIY